MRAILPSVMPAPGAGIYPRIDPQASSLNRPRRLPAAAPGLPGPAAGLRAGQRGQAVALLAGLPSLGDIVPGQKGCGAN
jgi:hypothetical protein